MESAADEHFSFIAAECQEAAMAYVCDTREIPLPTAGATPARTDLLLRIARIPGRVAGWLAAWGDAADEAAIGRDFFLQTGGKLTDGMERELMRRVMASNWNARD